ncbi:putative acetyltransferase [Chitinophaga terrae (ex Kim and Jung 2007)]|uniref:acetyltransferase n=1 Tax=Chitinophaga terrae (ex Kim and Jung 2007) TaxID=408074 RepID=UPI002780B631|nr:acetyltransferase [Chitinophaga terrae (ex Kim and Jung 2007)]MDQ0110147.1 putative acetyltransferase [Chitinophaga terrae (ex Kim and Jung 2007)]
MYNIRPVAAHEYLQLTNVWEASVRATHDFLSEADIQFFRPLILNEYLKAVELSCIKDEREKILGFIGIAGKKVEMLFVDPAARGLGVGKALMLHAIQERGINAVDVNEQNGQAVGFYKHLGFKVTGRSEKDSMGKPFPLLFMEL